MSTSSMSEVDCWNCRRTNNIVYGGEASKGSYRCVHCNRVIADRGIDSLTVASDKSEALSIKERRGDFTKIERIKRRLGLL